jgi:hypothetical protein
MEVLQTLAVALGLAALSGYSLYLTVFATGLAIHFHWIHLASQYASLSVLGEPPVIIISGVLFFFEFFADKIPWVDSAWDAIHTLIRPVGGALLAIQTLGHPDPVFSVIVGLLAGGVSFAAHTVKAATRLVVNQSPEPFSNIAVSTGENLLVFGGLALLWTHPIGAFCVLVFLFTLAIFFLPKVWRAIRIKLWFILQKLQQPAGSSGDRTLENKLPSRYDMVFHRLSDSPLTLAWAELCVSGKGKRIESNRFGYLAATEQEPAKVYFIRYGWLGGASKMFEIEDFNVSVEPRFLYDELNLYSPGKNERYTFKFDRSRSGVASKIAEDLQHRRAHEDALTLAPPVSAGSPGA